MALSVKPSFWEANTFLKNQDVIIIGGGIVGLTTAMSMIDRQSERRITILERGPIPMGASTRNAGFACFGSISELLSDHKVTSLVDLKRIISMRKKGLDMLRNLVPDEEMDFQQSGGYEYFAANQQDEYEVCQKHIDQYNSIVKDATGLDDTFKLVRDDQFGFKSTIPLIYNQHEGQLHPGKMINYLTRLAVSKGIQIINGADVQHVDESPESVHAVLRSGHSFSATQLIHTNNAFVKDLIDISDVEPVRNQVYVTERIPDLSVVGCFHCQEGYVYFRNVEDRILIGGARQHFTTEDTCSFGQTKDIESYLREFIVEELGLKDSISFEYGWSGILAVGSSKQPVIKQISERQYVGVRMGGMGVAIGSFVGSELANLTFS